jgi:hypothetical protein
MSVMLGHGELVTCVAFTVAAIRPTTNPPRERPPEPHVYTDTTRGAQGSPVRR